MLLFVGTSPSNNVVESDIDNNKNSSNDVLLVTLWGSADDVGVDAGVAEGNSLKRCWCKFSTLLLAMLFAMLVASSAVVSRGDGSDT